MSGSAPMIGWLYLPVAAGLGALHALEPGHGKTLMSLFLVGSKATIKNALSMGIVIGVTHTAVVAALAIPAVLLTQYFNLDSARQYLALAGAIGLCGLGLWMVYREGKALYTGQPSHSHAGGACCAHDHGADHHHDHNHNHNHDHEHDHDHDHPATVQLTQLGIQKTPKPVPVDQPGLGRGEVLSLGFSAGLMPCPTAVAVLIAGLSTGQVFASFATVLGFSFGVAGALSAVGIAVVLGARYASGQVGKRDSLKRAAMYFPIISASVVVLLGIFMLTRAFHHAPEPLPETNIATPASNG